MKKLLLILLCLPFIGFGQFTMIPDPNFEQVLINLGYDNGAINGSVYTVFIDTATSLNVSNNNIYDLTGIEAFTALTYLDCGSNNLTTLDVSNNMALTFLSCQVNQLTSLDVSNNTALTHLYSSNNQLTTLDVSGATALSIITAYGNSLSSLDVSNNTTLTELHCHVNQLTSLDVSNNPALTTLSCSDNQLTSLDLSQNTALWRLYCTDNQITGIIDLSGAINLYEFWCGDNQLTNLDVKNGNNQGMWYFNSTNNPNLTCINVDDFQYSLFNWPNIDPQHYFSNNCSGTAIEEQTTNKELLRTIDLLGRETKHEPLFYIYDDGTVVKRIVIE